MRHNKEICECCKNEQPLLTIELQDESSVPVVFYKGEEIKLKVNVLFEWDTADAYDEGGLTYSFEHYERDREKITVNRVERRTGKHA